MVDVVGTDFHEVLNGTSDDDVINGLSGYDTLDCGEGSDVYIVNAGDFQNRYVDFYLDSGTSGTDTILAAEAGVIIGIGDGFSYASSGNEVINGLEGSTISGDNDRQVWDFTGVEVRGVDLIYGMGGHDEIHGSNGNDTIDGGTGNDTILGSEGHDQLFGDQGRDRLNGGDGHDRLFGGDGRDFLNGNAGYDYLDGGEGSDVYYVGLDNAGFVDEYNDTGTSGRDVIRALEAGTVIGLMSGFGPNNGIEFITAGRNADVTIGGTNDAEIWDFSQTKLGRIAWINALDGHDSITGNWQNNRIDAGAGNDFVDGGAGNDYIKGGEGLDILNGGDGNDRLEGGSGNDTLIGGAGRDRLFGEDGDDDLDGGLGRDRLDGGAGNDRLDGGADNDFLNGGDGFDMLSGGAGRDRLNGGEGNDVMDGGEGDDVYLYYRDANGSFDTITDSGTSSRDRIVAREDGVEIGLAGPFSSANGIEIISGGRNADVTIQGTDGGNSWDFSGIRLYNISSINTGDGMDVVQGNNQRNTINGEAGHDQIYGGRGADNLFGGDDSDFLFGEQGRDQLFGENGHDILDGGWGRDILSGGEGHDILIGGRGRDTLIGGEGYDIFQFGPSSGHDVIKDFNLDDDMIDLRPFEGAISYDDLEFEQTDLGLKIKMGNNSVLLENIFLEDISADHFILFTDDTDKDSPTIEGKLAGEDAFSFSDAGSLTALDSSNANEAELAFLGLGPFDNAQIGSVDQAVFVSDVNPYQPMEFAGIEEALDLYVDDAAF